MSGISVTDGITTLTLSSSLLHLDKWNGSGVAGSEEETLGNRLVVYRSAGRAKSVITLEAVLVNGTPKKLLGSWTWSQGQQCRTWSDAGTPLTLTVHADVYQVVIPLAGINITPVFQKTNPTDDALCSGTIDFREV